MIRTTITILFLHFSCLLYAQPDLVLSSGTLLTTTISRGNSIKLVYRVKNTGNATAGKSHTRIYFSTTPTLTNAILLSEVSCESLIAGQETGDVNFIYPLPYNCFTGTNYILILVDSRNEIAETNENNTFPLNPSVTVPSTNGGQQNLPYPVIFVHGLYSDKTTWFSLINDLQNWYGWSYGGNMNFCLNQDNNIYTSNLSNDYKDWTVMSSLGAADLYTVNFDVDINGLDANSSTRIESNESAIKKQGLAIRDAIKHVLQVTGRDKVILTGHSMGGLASREYIQNPAIWQSVDGRHHVAKLLTIGTPHGGSNIGLGILNPLIDEYSEAVRDLRTTYYVSGDSGVYLFGGIESYAVMNDSYFFNFNNVDVNCNGVDNDGTLITGLNHKPISTDIDYTCIIGKYLGAGNDGIVSVSSANLNTYYNQIADTFIVNAFHTNQTSQSQVIIHGLHEPVNNQRSIEIKYSTIYFGNFTRPNATSSTPVDSNYYFFNVAQGGILTIELFNIPVPNAGIRLYNSSNNLLFTMLSDGKADSVTSAIPLTPGTYYLNISALPDIDAWKHPYAFKLSFTNVLPLRLLEFSAVKKEMAATLRWTTTNEINTDKFIVERSTGNNNWISLVNISALHDPSGTNSYIYTDLNPVPGVNYYRLKMTDINGHFTYSETRKVVFGSDYKPFTLSPNPASFFTLLTFNGTLLKGRITVYDAQGKLVSEDVISGINYTIRTDKLSPGFYLVKVDSGNGAFTKMLIVSR